MSKFLAVLFFALLSYGQTTAVSNATNLGVLDNSGAVATQPVQSGNSDPATCTSGKGMFINTSSTPALKLCTATNTWTAVGGGGGGGSHTVFLNMGGIVSGGGFNDSVNCTVASNTGFSALTGNVDGPLGPNIAHGATGYIACWIDLSSWDGNALTMRFYSTPTNGGLGGGTVIWSAATSCKTFSTTGVDFGTTYGTASNANSYNASALFNTYMTSVALPLTGCTAGSGHFMTIQIKRATDTELTTIALTGVSITGVF